MVEDRENLLTLVLDGFARDSSEISVFGSDGTNIFLSKHILMLFSPFVSRLLSSTSPCLESSLIVPDTSTDCLLTIGEILENGFTTTYNKGESSDELN